MEITIKKTIEKKVNIEVPYYAKSLCYAYKVIAENDVLCVQFYGSGTPRLQTENYFSDMILDGEPITKQEFNEIYNEVLTKLNEKL